MVKILPRSAQSKILGLQPDGKIKIKLTAAPVDNAANTQLINLLAKELRTAKSNIALVKGSTSRDKTLEILGVGDDVLREVLGINNGYFKKS